MKYMDYYFFNPENDLSLSMGEKHYNPPKSIVSFANDLSLLPIWYADEGASVIVRQNIEQYPLNQYDFGINACESIIHINDYWKKSNANDVLMPWGWSYSLKNEWLSKGKSKQCVDTVALRNLSSREQVISILGLPSFRTILPSDFVMPKKLETIQEAKSFIESYPKTILKAPWSSSGKGLSWVDGQWNDVLEKWVAKLLSHQGFLMGEVCYENQKDFAMEFYSNGEEVTFVGYSLFLTENGKYKGNLLRSNERLESILTRYVKEEELKSVQNILSDYFTKQLAPSYKGYFGVDMMVCRHGEDYFIHPCVEVNLRMNMGVVSRILHDRYMDKDAVGLYVVDSFPSHEQLMEMCGRLADKYPLKVRDGKVLSGFLPLTYYKEDALSVAYMLVGDII